MGKSVVCKECRTPVNKIYAKGLCSGCNARSSVRNRRKRKYDLAGHGSKNTIQKAFGVTGKTHESEHTIGYAVLSPYKRGKSSEARSLENNGLAYQEKHSHHRAHIGTGSHGTPDASNLNSSQYREHQGAALEEGSVSNAIQLNQLCYAFIDGFQNDMSDDMEKANGSFAFMLANASRVTYAKADGSTIHVGVNEVARCESYLARLCAGTGAWPTDKQIGDAKRLFGIPTNL